MLNNLPIYEGETTNELSDGHNLYEQSDIRYSLMGYAFNFNDDVWKLSSNISINWKLLEEIKKESPIVKEVLESQEAYQKKSREWTKMSDYLYLKDNL